MTEKRKGKRQTRGDIVVLKAAKLAAQLGESPLPESESVTEGNQPVTGLSKVEPKDAQSESKPRVDLLRKEIGLLRDQLKEKTAEYRLLSGNKARGESKTVAQFVAMLGQDAGVTKAKLIAETGAKKGYVDALLNRILPSRGYTITSFPIEGERGRAYRIAVPKAEDVLVSS